MARFRNYLLVVVGFAAAGMIGTAFGTGTAQAVVSTLVSVVNPTTSPVPVLTLETGRAPYQSMGAGTCSGVSCTFTFGSLPSGHRLLLSSISGTAAFNTAPVTIYVEIDVGGVFKTGFFVDDATPAVPFAAIHDFLEVVLDSPSSVSVKETLFGNGATFLGGNQQNLVLVGEEDNCASVDCQPIATQ